jgi:anti-anti-sigma factor
MTRAVRCHAAADLGSRFRCVRVVPGGAIGEVRVSGHVCWVVDDPGSYVTSAAGLLTEGIGLKHKPVVFGPPGKVLGEVAAMTAATALDPMTVYSGFGNSDHSGSSGGKLDPAVFCGLLRAYAAQALDGGYRGLRVAADMDWLLPFRPETAQIIDLELQLDRLVAELDVTLVCAYRTSSFDTPAIVSALTAHSAPRFWLTAAGPRSWQLSGEIDRQARDTFEAALGAVASFGDCVIDVSGLRFVDVSGMRALADASHTADGGIRLHGASPGLRRLWDLCGFAQYAPAVRLAP